MHYFHGTCPNPSLSSDNIEPVTDVEAPAAPKDISSSAKNLKLSMPALSVENSSNSATRSSDSEQSVTSEPGQSHEETSDS